VLVVGLQAEKKNKKQKQYKMIEQRIRINFLSAKRKEIMDQCTIAFTYLNW